MASKAELAKTLKLISRAWGKQSGYCFFPYIDRAAQAASGLRRAGYHESEPFEWPKDREKIVDHMAKHQDKDLYWCPMLFEYPVRRVDAAMDEHALWADLDEANPEAIDPEYTPTIAWESSPGRYQALWIAASGDFQGASWPGNENQRLTYLVGADQSGWDTTQLLRIPGWVNHKLDRVIDGQSPKGQLLWSDGPTYHPGDFADLPEVQGSVAADLTDAMEAEIDGVDRHKVIARIRLKLTRRAREMLSAKETSGDLSSQLWYLIRCLADVGCTVAEIVAVAKGTVWNKFDGRADEHKRLIIEASKAIAQRSEDTEAKLELQEDEPDRGVPVRLSLLLANVKRPKYLIDKVLTEGACGFIAGEPKSYKSWFGFDMAMSMASGADFLGHFRVVNPGPVLYVQEEDPPAVLKSRAAKIWASKSKDELQLVTDSGYPELMWLPPNIEHDFDPKINAYVQRGLVISDEAWQIWLDETLAAGMDGEPYKLMVIDTLMMVAGDVEENRAQEMTTKIFKPLKVLSRKHNCAIQVVHHMGKAERARAGQRMLGSVANHAWSEDSLYLSRSTNGDLKVEGESKSGVGGVWRVSDIDRDGWAPIVGPWKREDEPQAVSSEGGRGRPGARTARPTRVSPALKALDENGDWMTTRQLGEALSTRPQSIWKQLRRLEDDGKVLRERMDNGADRWKKA